MNEISLIKVLCHFCLATHTHTHIYKYMHASVCRYCTQKPFYVFNIFSTSISRASSTAHQKMPTSLSQIALFSTSVRIIKIIIEHYIYHNQKIKLLIKHNCHTYSKHKKTKSSPLYTYTAPHPLLHKSGSHRHK